MQEFIYKVKTTFFTKDFIKFLIIGVINTFNSTIFAMLYGVFLDPNLAFVAGYISSLCLGYILNSKFIFYENFTFQGLIKFGISYIPNFIIQNSIVFIGYNVLKLAKVIAYLSAAIVGIPVTFICVKFFAFKKARK